MITKVIMPRYGWTMTEGKIIQWLKKEGEEVKAGEPLVIIETEKTQVEVEAETSGVLRKIVSPEGTSVPITEVIAIVGSRDETLPETGTPRRLEVAVASDEVTHRTPNTSRVSPRAKRIAEKYGIDLRQIQGTGPDGLIVADDIMKAAKSTGSAAKERIEQPRLEKISGLTGRRKTIAERMTFSSRTAAAVTITAEADVSEGAELLRKLKKEGATEMTYTDLVAIAVAKALQEYPLLNSVWKGDEAFIPSEINLGIAVADQEGLIVPVIKNAENMSLKEIAEHRTNLIKRVREGKLSAEEAVGGTFTITNLGTYGVVFFTPIVNPPESAILGVGEITQKPVAIDGLIGIRPMMPLSLTFDHRLIDGAPAAIFLKRVKELLEKATLLAQE